MNGSAQGSPNSPPPQNKIVAQTKIAEDSNSLKASRMATLLSIEAGAREAESPVDLAIKLVNDPRSLTKFDQAFFLEKTGPQKYKTIAVTSQDSVNTFAPTIQMVEACAQYITLKENPDQGFGFEIGEIETAWKKEQQIYPFRHFHWMPILTPGRNSQPKLLGGLLIARMVPWRDVDLIVLRRIVDTYAHSWQALKTGRKTNSRKKYNRKLMAGAGLLISALILALPVPYTAVAPAQIIAKDPWVVSAPVEGVIDKVHVDPNQVVSADQPLFSFVDTALRNGAQIADSELILAEARSTNIKRAALIDSEGKREIAITNAERSLAKTRQEYARELLGNVHISAPQNGIALFTDKNDLTGRPVVIGEKIMEIADPSNVAISIEVPPGDALTMTIGQSVNVYLDVDPLKAIKGTLTRASFSPRKTQSGTLAYTGTVELEDNATTIPRIGLRGSAKLKVGDTSLGFWLFRKPIVVVRRTLGV